MSVRLIPTLMIFLLADVLFGETPRGTSAESHALTARETLPGLQEVTSRPEDPGVTAFDGAAAHRIGPRDLLQITVWNGEMVQRESLRVAEDGTLFLPFGLNRTLLVAGLTSSQLKRVLREELLKYFRAPEVQVLVEEFQSRRAYLLGEIGTQTGEGPGLYPLEGRKRVLEFIIQHGGFTDKANLTRVQVNRADGKVLTVNMADVIFRGEDSQNVVLEPGDIVWVPSIEVAANTYFVFGEVRAPGVVLSQEKLSLIEVISRAGSLGPDASRDGVYIARGDLGRPEIIQIDLEQIIQRGDFSQNIVLEDNDVIFVTKSGGAKFRDVVQSIAPLVGILRDTVVLFQVLD